MRPKPTNAFAAAKAVDADDAEIIVSSFEYQAGCYLRRPEFQLLNPIAGVLPTPLSNRGESFSSFAGALCAMPAKAAKRYVSITRGDLCID